MKRTYPYIALAALALGFTACTQDEDFAPQQSDIVQIASANIATEVQSRVNTLGDGTTWDNGDIIYLKNTSRDDRNEGTYTYNGSTWSLSSGMVLYASGKNNFTAYYPAGYTTLPTEQDTEAGIKSADYMTASADNVDKGTAVSLSFEHQNVKVTITPNFNTQYDGKNDISDFQINGIKAYKNGNDYVAILEPTTADFSVTLTIGGDNLTAPCSTDLEKGKHYTFTLTVGKKVASLTGVSVNPWTGETVSGSDVEEIYINSTVTGTTAVINIVSEVTDEVTKKIQSLLTENSNIATLIVPGTLSAAQQTALAAALGSATDITLVIDDMAQTAVTESITGLSCTTIYEGHTVNTEGTYEVYSAKGLEVWRTAASSAPNTNLTLKADIILTGENNWTPLGDESNGYTGTIDGGGHTITGLRINSTSEYSAFLGYLGADGTVKDLTFADAVVSGNSCSAIFVSLSEGTIENCHVASSCTITSSEYIGGVVALNIGTIIGCTNAATITSEVNYVGGIVGSNYGPVIGCINYGDVSGILHIGGIAGDGSQAANTSKIVACANYGEVTATKQAGGLVGYKDNWAYIYGSWTVACTEKDGNGDVTVKDGIGDFFSNSEDGIKACYSFATTSDVTAEVITAMNNAISTYNNTASVTCNYTWVAGSDGGYPTLQKVTSDTE